VSSFGNAALAASGAVALVVAAPASAANPALKNFRRRCDDTPRAVSIASLVFASSSTSRPFARTASPTARVVASTRPPDDDDRPLDEVIRFVLIDGRVATHVRPVVIATIALIVVVVVVVSRALVVVVDTARRTPSRSRTRYSLSTDTTRE
jgi:hypothetical protein